MQNTDIIAVVLSQKQNAKHTQMQYCVYNQNQQGRQNQSQAVHDPG